MTNSKCKINLNSKIKITSSSTHPLGECVVMSLRGSETTEAISKPIENKEIATLPPVARNDKMGLRHSLLVERGRSVRAGTAVVPTLATEVKGEAEIKGPRDAIFTG
jgi:hypothetical protein